MYGILACRFKHHLLALAVISLSIVFVLQTGSHLSEVDISNEVVSVSESHFPSTPHALATTVESKITTQSPSTGIQKYLVENVRNLPLENKLHQKLLIMDEYIVSLKSHLPDEYISEFRNPCWYSDLRIPSAFKRLQFSGVSQKDENSVKLKEKYLVRRPTSYLRVPIAIRAHSESSRERYLYCLPYFFLLGYAKTGTTSLYSLITTIKMFARPEKRSCIGGHGILTRQLNR